MSPVARARCSNWNRRGARYVAKVVLLPQAFGPRWVSLSIRLLLRRIFGGWNCTSSTTKKLTRQRTEISFVQTNLSAERHCPLFPSILISYAGSLSVVVWLQRIAQTISMELIEYSGSLIRTSVSLIGNLDSILEKMPWNKYEWSKKFATKLANRLRNNLGRKISVVETK